VMAQRRDIIEMTEGGLIGVSNTKTISQLFQRTAIDDKIACNSVLLLAFSDSLDDSYHQYLVWKATR
jgi:hypothetical protein